MALTVLPELSITALVPNEKIPLSGRLLPAGPILLLLIELPSLPVVVPVLKCTTPNEVVPEPCNEQLVMVLLTASAINRIVLDAPNAALENVRELPAVLSPFIVTLSAPFKSTK